MLAAKALTLAYRYAPLPVKRLVRAIFPRAAEPAPPLARRGVIEDLCFWMADERVDTVLPLQNYFSVLFPDLETTTHGTLELYDGAGRALGRHAFALPAHALVKLRVGDIVRGLAGGAGPDHGTLFCDIAVPSAVLGALDAAQPFHFWDRFYIAYEPRGGVPCFVHGIDKTWIADAVTGARAPFYPEAKRYVWVPEIPVDLAVYQRLSVVLVNRTETAASLTLTVTDGADARRAWSADVAARGAHRFVLTADGVAGLDARDLRLRVDGIPTRWGRPVIFKEFANGAISAMHC